ncbi:MAG: twin-arginine translocation signal domain-containing protein [Candidatus Acidiferrales bacterium]
MKRISRREFHRLAAVGAIAGAAASTPLAQGSLIHSQPPQLAQAQTTASKPPVKLLLTADQEKKVQDAIAEREKDVATMRSRTLPYSLEPAFVFHVCAAARRSPAKG